MPLWLALIFKFLGPYLAGLLTTPLTKGLGKLIGKAKDATPDPAKDAALDALEQQLDSAFTHAVVGVGNDLASGANAQKVVQDGIDALKALIDPAVIPGLEVLLEIGIGSFWGWVTQRLADKASHGKVLNVSPEQISKFESLTLAQRRALIAAKGLVVTPQK